MREIGCSNFSAAQIREAGGKFVSVQNHYSLFHREPEAEVLPECEREHIAFLPYFPLANGLLTGKYRQGQPLPKGSRGDAGWGPKMFTEENLGKVERLIQFAEGSGHTLLESGVLLAGSQARGGIRHRRSDHARTSARQRLRRQLEAHFRRSGADRQDHGLSGTELAGAGLRLY